MKQKSNVWVFMLVAYGFSWLFWGPEALIAQGIWNAPEGVKSFLAGPFNLGPWGPLFAAIVVTFMYQGATGVIIQAVMSSAASRLALSRPDLSALSSKQRSPDAGLKQAMGNSSAHGLSRN